MVQLAERRAKAERKAAFEAAQKAKAERLAAAEAAQDEVNSHLLMKNVNQLNQLWQTAQEPPSKKDVDSISAQVSWLQEFCDHLVENSLSRSALVATSCGATCTPLHGLFTCLLIMHMCLGVLKLVPHPQPLKPH